MKALPLTLCAALCGFAAAEPASLESGIPSFLDTDGDGVISEEERQAFAESRRNASATTGGPGMWDGNGDGVVDETERETAIAELKGRMENRRSQLFLNLAGDDEVVDFEEFLTLTPVRNMPVKVVDRLFAMLDKNEDEVVDLDEFLSGPGVGTGRSEGKPETPVVPETPELPELPEVPAE